MNRLKPRTHHIQSPAGHWLGGQILLGYAEQSDAGQRPCRHQQHANEQQSCGQHQHRQNGRLCLLAFVSYTRLIHLKSRMYGKTIFSSAALTLILSADVTSSSLCTNGFSICTEVAAAGSESSSSLAPLRLISVPVLLHCCSGCFVVVVSSLFGLDDIILRRAFIDTYTHGRLG